MTKLFVIEFQTMLHQGHLGMLMFWGGSSVPGASLSALPNLHFTHSTASKPPENKAEDGWVQCSWSGHKKWFRQLCVSARERKAGQPEEKVWTPGTLWGHGARKCITANCSAFLWAVEDAGSGRQDNPEYLLLCQAALSQRNVQVEYLSCTTPPLAFSVEHQLKKN